MSAPNPISHEPLHGPIVWPPQYCRTIERVIIEFPSTPGAKSANAPDCGPSSHPRRPAPLWLPIFGAAIGLIWAGVLAMLIGWHIWLFAPIVVGAAYGALIQSG